jgi:hypothetical protein
LAVAAGIITTVAGSAAGAGGGTQAQAQGHGHGHAEARKVIMAEGADRLPSTTAADWVTYADHVVVVAATSEQVMPPSRSELERGEGLLGRKVRLEVKDVLWSREGAPQPAPSNWDYNAIGSVFTNGRVDRPTPVALHERPRFEAGHQYIMAIQWRPARCSPGDAPEPAGWVGLGEGSELPFDGGVIGQGESEGRPQSAAEARTHAAGAKLDAGLEEELAGGDAVGLAGKLKAATPGKRRQEFGPSASQESCG